MALGATLYQLHVTLSDIERNVYQSLELRVARHPSETVRYLWTRSLAYCLCYEEGIAFSKGGLSNTDEPALSVFDATGRRHHWIEVGSPSAERLHRASKATDRVSLFSYGSIAPLRKEAIAGNIHRADRIVIGLLEARFLDALESQLDRKTHLELVHNEGQLYVTIGSQVTEGTLSRTSLLTAEFSDGVQLDEV
jgi:uncharacterized protein YaeQ